MEFVKASILVLFAISLLNCASPQILKNQRKGLFDHFSEYNVPLPELSKDLKMVATKWVWPLKKVALTSPFGQRGHEFHEGIDLRAKRGTPVYSVSDGRVIYAGSGIKGYGKMLVIKHWGDFNTVYAHNSKLLVKRGQRVKKGKKIALTGSTGHSSGPHLHFEVRKGVVALNPVKILPPSSSWTSRVIASSKR